MLVILMDNQLLPPASVCPTCLMADQGGQPRWHNGRLQCGRQLQSRVQQGPVQYECQMGFRVAEIE
jgi:hypothetical protein